MKVLVLGGAGYIGSHMVKMLLDLGHEVVTLDNLSTGFRDAVNGGEFIQGDLSDRALLDMIFASHQFNGLMHFASLIQVGESVANPAKYYHNNLAGLLMLLDAMIRHNVGNLVFSSSAAIFGEPAYLPLDEAHPKKPLSPYGKSKLMVEMILEDYARAYGLQWTSLRYFNAAGADPTGLLGERHQPETHLIPLVLQVASGRRESIPIYGQDYDTMDGTCVRDYVHVVDLCSAHLLAWECLLAGSSSGAYNLGTGRGYSIREVIEMAERVTGKNIRTTSALRREGDPARLVADATCARNLLGWRPRYDELEIIMQHAWKWEQRLQARSITTMPVHP